MALTTQRKQSTHHKKMRGAHHRHTKNYLKSYSPYLPLLLVVVIGLAVNSLWHQRLEVLGATTNLTASSMIQDTNLERARNQQPDLALSKDLSAAAQAKANDMVLRDYWSHNAPDGTTPWSFLERNNYSYETAGENLAYGFTNANTVVTGWMNSPEHRANILNPGYQEIGIGITHADNFLGRGKTTVVVAMYAQPLSSDMTVSATVDNSKGLASASTKQPYRNVSRIDVLTDGQATWSVLALSVVTLLGMTLIVFRHGLAWHRVLVRSEDFVLSHKLLDVVVLTVVVASVLLTRSAGFIH